MKSFLGNFYRYLAFFSGHTVASINYHWGGGIYLKGKSPWGIHERKLNQEMKVIIVSGDDL